MAADLQSLQDLAGEVETAAGRSTGPRPEARRPWPRLRHRQAQGRRSPASGSAPAPASIIRQRARTSPSIFARPVLQMIVQSAGGHADQSQRPVRHQVATVYRRRPVRPGWRPVRHGHLQGAHTTTSRSCAACLRRAATSPATARVVERKKYGKRKARRSFQFSKR